MIALEVAATAAALPAIGAASIPLARRVEKRRVRRRKEQTLAHIAQLEEQLRIGQSEPPYSSHDVKLLHLTVDDWADDVVMRDGSWIAHWRGLCGHEQP